MSTINYELGPATLDEAAAIAAPDLDTDHLADRLSSAERQVVRCQSECDRLRGLAAELHGDVANLNDRIKSAKVQALTFTSEGKGENAEPIWDEINRLRTEKGHRLDALSYVTSFAGADANLNLLEAEIVERERAAALLEAQAIAARKALLAKVSEAAATDPGFTVNFKESKSQRLLEMSASIHREIEGKREALNRERERVAREQDLAGPRLWNT